MSLNSNHMPWYELIKAFIDNLPRRMNCERTMSPSASPTKNLQEFRTLTIGGYRQSGKSTAAFDIIRENPNSRLIGSYVKGFTNLAQNDDVVRSRILTADDIDQEHMAGVKLLIIDTNGYKHPLDDPFDDLLLVHRHHHDWFDPEFSVIHFL